MTTKTLSWFFPMLSTRGYLFNYALGGFYGGLTAIGTMIQIIKNRKEFFKSTQRTEPPKCLTDKRLGRHNYIQCKVYCFVNFNQII